MAYQVVVKKSVIKALSKVNEPDFTRLKKAIYKLAEDPRPTGYKQLKNRPGCRIRVGNYRIIYDIHEDELTVMVLTLGHRKDVYR